MQAMQLQDNAPLTTATPVGATLDEHGAVVPDDGTDGEGACEEDVVQRIVRVRGDVDHGGEDDSQTGDHVEVAEGEEPEGVCCVFWGPRLWTEDMREAEDWPGCDAE